jgi:hypothetical protein
MRQPQLQEGDVVTIDADHEDWGRACGGAIVAETPARRARTILVEWTDRKTRILIKPWEAAFRYRPSDWTAIGTTVHNRGTTKTGQIVGFPYTCNLEGCLGARVSVRWDDGALTRLCTKALRRNDDGTLQLL